MYAGLATLRSEHENHPDFYAHVRSGSSSHEVPSVFWEFKCGCIPLNKTGEDPFLSSASHTSPPGTVNKSLNGSILRSSSWKAAFESVNSEGPKMGLLDNLVILP